MAVAALIVAIAGYWLIIGGVVAAMFVLFGVDRIDEDARGAYAFRPLLIPGILLIWPLVVWQWLRLETGGGDWMKRYQPPRSTHLPAAIIMALAMAFAVIAGLAVRQEWPADFTPEQLIEGEK